MKKLSDVSPKKAVTILRFLYPIWAILGIITLQYIPGKIVVAGDALMTAANIVANQTLFSISIVGGLVAQLIHIVAVLVLYKLFKSVDKNQALLIVVLGLIGVPITMLGTLNQAAAMMMTKRTEYMSAFDPTQLQALTMLFLDLFKKSEIISWLFWGLWLFPQGILIIKSGYFPRVFGFLMILAGFGYFLGSFVYFLLPNNQTLANILNLLTMGEVAFMAWVMIKGAKFGKNEIK